MSRNKNFGRLLSEGIVSVAKKWGQKIGDVEMEIADQLGYSRYAVQRWRRGYVPPDPECVEFLVRYCVTNGRVGRQWAQSILTQARYPKAQMLVDELFPAPRDRGEFPHPTHNLPGRWGLFLGRGPDLEAVREALNSSWPVVLIEGMGGIGKTTLALEVAYACAGQPRKAASRLSWPHYDYIVWLSAAGREITFELLLDTIAHRLGYPGLTQRNLPEKAEDVRDILAQQPVLLVVDNFETVTDQRISDFIVRLPGTTKVLLTGREGAHLLPPAFHRYPPARIRLGGLPDKEALAFLRQEARRRLQLRRGRPRAEQARLEAVVRANDETLLPLVKATEGNPKALALSLGYIADEALALSRLIHDLYAAAESVSRLFDYLFQQAWERCGAHARTLWMVIPFFAAPVRREALKAASGLQGRYFRDALEDLLARSLIEVVEGADGEPRYRAHPLVRAYGQSRLQSRPEFEQEARDRWVRWYANFLAQQDAEDWPALQTLDTKRENVLGLLDWALKHKHPLAPKLVKSFWYFLYIRGEWHACESYTRQAVDLARSRGEIDTYLWLKSRLGWLLAMKGEMREAFDVLHDVKAEVEGIDRPELIAETDILNYLAQAYLYQGHLEQAESYLLRHLQLCERTGDARGALAGQYYLGRLKMRRGHLKEAEEMFRALVERAREIRWERAEGYCAYRLAETLLHEGEAEEAEQWLNHAWMLAERWGDQLLQAYGFLGRAMLLAHRGQIDDALRMTRESYSLYRRLGMRMEQDETLQLIKRLETMLESADGKKRT